MRDGLELDVHYVEECSLRLDLLILLRTVPVVLRWGRAR
jgi:lipopolysaccharide/colanic/teichoic acid biosynthesis glycosyltransferase